MSEPTLRDMAIACFAYYGSICEVQDTDSALRLLRKVGQRAGWHIQMTISSAVNASDDLYTVWIEDLTGIRNGRHEAETLSEAAIRCAWANIPKEGGSK